MLARRKESQSTESQAEILRAAVRLIAERGCAGATVARIAEEAGLSTAAVFWHFKDKSRLFQAVAQHIKDTWGARVKADALAQGTGRARLERLIENQLGWIASDDAHLRAFVLLGLEAQGMGEPATAARVGELGTMFTTFLTKVIREGQEDGTLAPGIAAERAASVLASTLFGAVVQNAIGGSPGRSEDVAHIAIAGLLGAGAVA